MRSCVVGCFVVGHLLGWVGKSDAELSVFLDDQQQLVLQGTGVELLALEFQSPSGSLLASQDAGPFQGTLSETGSWALFYSLGTPAVVDGTVTLATRWDPSGRNDVLFQYGTFTEEVELQPIEGHSFFASQVGDAPVLLAHEQEVLQEMVRLSSDFELTGFADRTGISLYFSEPRTVTQISIQSSSDELVPRGPTEFDSLAQPSPFQVELASDAGLDLADGWRLPIAWNGDDFADLDLSMTTMDGATVAATWISVVSLPEPRSEQVVVLLLVGFVLRMGRRPWTLRSCVVDDVRSP